MKILLISYFSPADNITGGFRSAGFSKYFPEEDIDVTLLTSNADLLENQDMLKEYKFISPEIVRGIKIRKIGYKLKVLALLELLKLDTLLFFPDIFRFWNRRAMKRGQSLIDKEKFDAILVTAPPHSSSLFAEKLARKNNIPLIVDYRDPLTGCPFVFFPPIIKQLVKRKEKKIAKRAKMLVTVGEEYSEIITNNLKLEENRFHIIYNGFFEETQPEIAMEKSKKFTIAYFGHFYLQRQKGFEILARSLKEIIVKHNLTPDEITLKYAGKISRKTLHKITESAGITDYFKDLGLLVDRSLFTEISQSTLNVAIIPPKVNYNLPNKIYDYAVCNSHILLIGEKGEASKWCEKVHQHYTHVPMNENLLTDELWKLFTEWKNGTIKYGCDLNEIKQFSRKNMALKLAKIIRREIE